MKQLASLIETFARFQLRAIIDAWTLAGCLAAGCWLLAGWLAGWLGWLAGWLAVWLAGWQAGWADWLLAGCLEAGVLPRLSHARRLEGVGELFING